MGKKDFVTQGKRMDLKLNLICWFWIDTQSFSTMSRFCIMYVHMIGPVL